MKKLLTIAILLFSFFGSAQIIFPVGSGNIGNTDAQKISISGNTLTLENGGTIDLSGYLDNTDSQTITDFSLSANILSITLSGGNTITVDLSGISGGGGSSTAATTSIDNTNFGGAINGSRTTVQEALEDLDDIGAGSVGYSGPIYNGSGYADLGGLLNAIVGDLNTGELTDNQSLTVSTDGNTISLEDGGEISSSDIRKPLTLTEFNAMDEATRLLNEGRTVVDYNATIIDEQIINPEDFGAVGDGVTDDTAAFQEALNSSENKKLKGTPGKIYLLESIDIPLFETYIDLTGCDILYNPSNYDINKQALFYVDPRLRDKTTGLPSYPQQGTVDNWKVQEKITIDGGNYDFRFNKLGILGTGALKYAEYIVVEPINIINTTVKNIGGISSVVRISSTENVTESTSIVKEVNLSNNKAYNLGKTLGLVVTGDYDIGDTSVEIKSLDSDIPVSEKIFVGAYIKFGSHFVTSVSNGGYIPNNNSSTNAFASSLFRVTAITPTSDQLVSTISFEIGDYSTSTGFTARTVNDGLRAPIIENSWIVNADFYDYASLYKYPKFSGVSGSNIITRSDLSSLEDAYMKNLNVGQKISFASGGSKGVYTVTDISGNDVTVTPELIGDMTSSSAIEMVSPSDFFFSYGYVEKINLYKNKIDGGHRFVGGTGARNPEWKTQRKNDMVINMTFNEIEHCWMGVESSASTNSGYDTPITSFSSIDVTLNDTNLTIPNPETYKYTTVSGIPSLTNSGTETSTIQNCLTIGDIIRLEDIKGNFEITDIPSDFSTNPVIGVSRFDSDNVVSLGTGFTKTVTGSGVYRRLYSIFVGAGSGVGTFIFNDNKYKNGTRHNGGSYATSVFGGRLIAKRNIIDNPSHLSFESSAEYVLLEENIIYGGVWKGDLGGVGISQSSTGKGGGVIGDFGIADIYIKNNHFLNYQPTDESVRSSGISLAGRTFAVTEGKEFVIDGNYFSNMNGKLMYSGHSYNFGDTYKEIWETFTFKDNLIRGGSNANILYDNLIMLVGNVNIFKDNILVYNGVGPFLKVFQTTLPNTNLSIEPKVLISGNQYSVPTSLQVDTSILQSENIPVSTTSERPEFPFIGETVFDSDLGKLIIWNGSAWVNVDGTSL